ncbi:hypothetical protein BCR43DRAFT_3288 [Syncephalastrum racemosum]|uniref:Uncharacterized protein n=1 Tax=Syncephalastrum racemosum TaxID=13706 RepID=A0A1X2HRN5_SYNRA|nr:hypothetical protein BCR43DRAFT_3288 [Syncephalastrum racemosum]
MKLFELITLYLDPVLRPHLHGPDEMRLLRWMNRVCTKLNWMNHFHGACALGFCEVKPADSRQNDELCFTYLLRLALFSKSGIDKGEIQAIMVIHAIGPAVTFYVMELAAAGPYPLVELATITMPLTIVDALVFAEASPCSLSPTQQSPGPRGKKQVRQVKEIVYDS